MNFGDKIKDERKKRDLTQEALAQELGLTTKMISLYESHKSYPRTREAYQKIADYFRVDVNYLLADDASFMEKVSAEYGPKGVRQAQDLLSEINGLFAGGQMAEEDMDEMMLAIQEAYLIAKKKNKKYGRKQV